MTRLILLVILGIVTMAYFPESRAVLLDAVEPVVTPALRWHTANEIDRVARELKIYEMEHNGQLPEARGFEDWLNATLDFGGATDPWGGNYVLYQERDSFVVTSFGPDLLPGTGDDLRTAAVRERAEGR